MTEVLDRQLAELEKKSSRKSAALEAEANNNAVFAVGLCYIAMPCLIFLVSFVRPWMGWPLAAGLVLLLGRLLARTRWVWSMRLYVPAALLASGLVLLAGLPTGHSPYDWVKHWALIHEIATRPWPVTLDLNGEHVYLRFYLAAYLVPSLLHKALPVVAITVPVTIWFWLGYLLVFRAASVCYERRSVWVGTVAMVIPFIVSGAEIYVRHMLGGKFATPGWMGFYYGIWGALEFPTGFTSLIFVPHQSIPVLIVAAMILVDRGENSLARLLLGYGLLALWSPYGMVGLLPLLVIRIAEVRKHLMRGCSIAAGLFGGSFAVLVAAYLSTDLPAQARICVSCAVHRSHDLVLILTFLAMELVTWCLLLGRRLVTDRYCLAALSTLVILPFLHGPGPDVVARGSIGPLFLLGLRSAEHLFRPGVLRLRWLPLTFAGLICVPTIVSQLDYHLESGAAYRTPEGRRVLEAGWESIFTSGPNISAREFLDVCGWKFESQYFSRVRPRILRR